MNNTLRCIGENDCPEGWGPDCEDKACRVSDEPTCDCGSVNIYVNSDREWCCRDCGLILNPDQQRVRQLERELADAVRERDALRGAMRDALECFFEGHGWAKHIDTWSKLIASESRTAALDRLADAERYRLAAEGYKSPEAEQRDMEHERRQSCHTT